MQRLHEQLQTAGTIAISAIAGMGGIGKTELALQYAYKHLQLDDYPGGVCWLRSREEVGTQIVLFARSQLNLQPPEDLESLASQVQWCWRNWPAGDVLVVWDDVQQYADIQPWLPPGGESRFKVLLTSRSQFPEDTVRLFPLDTLPPLAAFQLLCESLPGDRRLEQEQLVAEALCEWLGYLPLGMKLVAAFLKQEPDLSFQAMLAQLAAETLKHDGLTKIQAVFELSWEKLSTAEQQLAMLLSLFAVAPLPWRLVQAVVQACEVLPVAQGWLRRLVAFGQRPAAPEQWCVLLEPKALERSRRQLGQWSLLVRTGEEQYELHPLSREFFAVKRSQMAEEEAMQRSVCRVMVAVAEQIPYTVTLEIIQQVTPAIPHLQAVATHLHPWLTDADLIKPATSLAWFYQGQSDFGTAADWSRHGLAIARDRLGTDHPDVATSLNNLALLYNSQGRYGEAEPLLLRALAIWQQQLGTDHPDVATSLNNVAALYYLQGRYGEAELLYLQALAIRQQQLGPDHPDVASSLNNVAALYKSQGRYGEAEPLYLRALAIRQRQLGHDHPDVATSLNNVAVLYDSQGRYGEAESLLLRALTIRQQQLGHDHPDVATSLNNVAALYKSQGRYGEAEPLYLQALAIRQQQLGPDHPDVASSLNNVAVLYDSQGRYGEAEPLYLQAMAIVAQRLGETHPTTQTVWGNFIDFLQQVIEQNATAELSDHPATQSILQQLQNQES